MHTAKQFTLDSAQLQWDHPPFNFGRPEHPSQSRCAWPGRQLTNMEKMNTHESKTT